MLTIVTWFWEGSGYEPKYVRALGNMLKVQMTFPYRLVAIMDKPIDLGPNVEVITIPEEARSLLHLKSPEGLRFPSCYVRLWLFSQAAKALGERILLTDLDVVVTEDWGHLVDYNEDFVGWRPLSHWGRLGPRLAGGMWMLRTGARTEVWDTFIADPMKAIYETRELNYRGSDQAWITRQLVDTAVVWPPDAGIRIHRECEGQLPRGTCVVHFKGEKKAWSPGARARHPWLKDYWPL